MIVPGDFHDDDSDYDMFDDGPYSITGTTFEKKKFSARVEKTIDQQLHEAVLANDIALLRELLENSEPKFDVNSHLQKSWTLLMHASKEGHLEIVQYLLSLNANPNRDFESVTPLMTACDCERKETTLSVVKALLMAGSVVNVSDRYGKTPLIYASIRGHVDVVQYIVAAASVEAADNWGSTALFHAVEHNHPEIVKILLENNAIFDVVNRSGNTPKELAELSAFTDIIALFPEKEEKPYIPLEYMTFSDYTQLAPTIFGTSEMPAYFPHVASMLFGMHCDSLIPHFFNRGINLEEFLVMDEKRLIDIGVEFPFQRKRILLGLLKFHSHPWKRQLEKEFAKKTYMSSYDVFQNLSGHLKYLIVMKATSKYLSQIFEPKCAVTKDKIDRCLEEMKKVLMVLSDLRERVAYLQRFNQPPPLLIDYHQHLRVKQSDRFRRTVMWTTILGIGFLLCRKFKNTIFSSFS